MHDVIVIGGGPAGSTAATLLAQKGLSVVLLERERFPRFQIGESLLPYNNDLFDRLGLTGKLEAGDFVPKYGAEFVTGDGSVGYTFRFDRNLEAKYHRSFQVKRSEFDHVLLRNAMANGVDVREETAVTSVDLSDPARGVVHVAGGETLEARFVIDAAGHACVVGAREGGKSDVSSLKKIAFFAHFRGVPRPEGLNAGNTIIVVIRNAWFWLIPITEELMSVGLVVDRDHFKSCGLTPEEILAKTIAATPFVADRMSGAERVTQVYARKDFSYEMQRIVGENFALIGDAAGFLDPIFSTGVFLAMKSADLASAAIVARLKTGRMGLLRKYERSMTHALRDYFRFISNFYRREFLEVFLQPKEDFGLLPVIIGVLAGNVFTARRSRWRVALFFFLIRVQKWRGVIAPAIAWDSLPRPASV
jgi:flavin-dependent dehydrogenase